MKLTDVFDTAKDAMAVERVYAEPVERDGTTLIGVAAISGGAGGGGGSDADGESGSGAGFGIGAKPVGAFVIRDGKVSWLPAVDVNRLIVVAGVVTLAALAVGARYLGRQCTE
ncbi:spore germination protein GerW family protein [Nocardia sp. MW-W600-9]